MKNILVDSSVWIEYSRGKKETRMLDELIDFNLYGFNSPRLAAYI
jgi:hypothetical protein